VRHIVYPALIYIPQAVLLQFGFKIFFSAQLPRLAHNLVATPPCCSVVKKQGFSKKYDLAEVCSEGGCNEVEIFLKTVLRGLAFCNTCQELRVENHEYSGSFNLKWMRRGACDHPAWLKEGAGMGRLLKQWEEGLACSLPGLRRVHDSAMPEKGAIALRS